MEYPSILKKMHQGVEQGIFPGAVLLCAKNGKVCLNEAFGLADIFCEKKMQIDSIFDLASLTKPLATTLAIAKLVEKKSKLLAAPIGSILRQYDQTDKETITVDMLLRHTSGFPAHREFFKFMTHTSGDPKKIQARLLVKEPLEYASGTHQVYSDLGFMVLRQVVEAMSGCTLDQYVTDKIYNPLEIRRLMFIPRRDHEQVMGQLGPLMVATQDCQWRNKVLVGEVDDENAWVLGGVDGHAGLFGDAISVFKICHHLLQILQGKSNEVIHPDTLHAFVQKTNGFEMVAGFDTPSKHGSSCGHYFSGSAIGHLGFTGTSFWIDPEVSLIVVLLTNRIHPSRSNQQLKKFRPGLHDLIYQELV